jgi:hypothetical protein
LISFKETNGTAGVCRMTLRRTVKITKKMAGKHVVGYREVLVAKFSKIT